MDPSFLFFIVFSFVLISLFVFVLLFVDQLKKIGRQFKWRQSIIYVLGSAFILVSLTLGYFIYLHFSLKLALAVFGVLNGSAIFLLRRASKILRKEGDRVSLSKDSLK